ncbi:MAG: hypothetical protein MR051_04500 [Lentisphaeria bacterium]|nr:hypothetical protein [Lentisphaeria bacterium]
MIRCGRWILLFFLLSGIGTGCLRADDWSQGGIEVSDICRGRGEGIVAAITAGNYEQFAQAAGEPQIAGDAEKFRRDREEIVRKYGKPVDFRFLTYLQTPLLINQIWVVDFVRRDREGRQIRQQQLFQLIFGEKDGQMRMLGMRFI